MASNDASENSSTEDKDYFVQIGGREYRMRVKGGAESWKILERLSDLMHEEGFHGSEAEFLELLDLPDVLAEGDDEVIVFSVGKTVPTNIPTLN